MNEQSHPHQENYQVTSGPLRSSVTIELHTHLATRLWQGRHAVPEEKIYAIIGMPRFLNIMNMLRLDSATDNPYADVWMLQLEERLFSAREEMNTLIDSMKTVFRQLPEMMTVESCLSVQPARFPVFAASQLGFIAVYLLTDFDQLMRQAQLAHHMALINRVELNDLRQRGGNLIRSIFVLAQRYRRIAVTRQDIYEGNARARAAEEQAGAGAVPDAIMDGSRRSTYAPPLRQRSDSASEPDADTSDPAPVSPPGVETGSGTLIAIAEAEDDESEE
ncbi:TIGR03761 family integrating conjugative element protein [Morganella morganii]|uniref:TIGR03761 family integrating conjugative element protein n=1 Tax=Morganella morganii TaxID=582 RepID=A0A433ZWL6_MORMO|nr:TIGR03761 family integrating conjugative element protein [Morganella morganii]RUT66521.1 TIGR03761 family integrating conjugative element protein [Morganella morganii]